MLFHNPSGKHLRFKLGSLVYDVPPGAECDIAPDIAFVVAKRGLPLVQGSAGGERVEASIAEPPPPKRYPSGVASSAAPAEPYEGEAPQVDDAIDRLADAGVLPRRRRRKSE